MEKLLSIIIINYNNLIFLKNTINKFKKFRQIEIIVVDDGSNDGSFDYFKKNNKFIKYYYKKNSGYGPSIELGINNSTGKYIKILDADDDLEIKSLEKLLNIIKNNETFDCIIMDYKLNLININSTCINNNKQKISFKELIDDHIYEIKTYHNYEKFDKYFMLTSIIYNKRILEKTKFKFNKYDYANDNIYVFFPLLYVKNFYFSKNKLYIYNVYGENQSISKKNREKFLISIFNVSFSFLIYFIKNFYKKKSSIIIRKSIVFLKDFLNHYSEYEMIINKIKLYKVLLFIPFFIIDKRIFCILYEKMRLKCLRKH